MNTSKFNFTFELLKFPKSLRELFNKIKIISILANNISVFRQVAFILAIVINILVLFSYKYYDNNPETAPENRGATSK